jgi:broad specificity phosphatase PhoE
VRLFLVARHAHSVLNEQRRISGNPSVDVPLTAQGEEEARRLGEQIAHVPIDVCIHTRFGRTRTTAELALAGRRVALECEPLLDDIDVGELDGATIDDYRAWKRAHSRKDRFPRGESLDEAALRYAEAYRRMLGRDERTTLVVCHEIPLRYALNGAGGSDQLDGPIRALPNATPYLFDEKALERALGRIDALAT